MPYLISIITGVALALVIFLSRYDADDSGITKELENTKAMFLSIDNFINTYIQSGGNMNPSNIQDSNKSLSSARLFSDNILSGNITQNNILDITPDEINKINNTGENNTNYYKSKLNFPDNNIIWQVLPIADYITKDYRDNEINLGRSVGAGYQLFINFSANSTLMRKSSFVENYLGREICEKILLGSFINDATSVDPDIQNILLDEKNSNGRFACIVYK